MRRNIIGQIADNFKRRAGNARVLEVYLVFLTDVNRIRIVKMRVDLKLLSFFQYFINGIGINVITVQKPPGGIGDMSALKPCDRNALLVYTEKFLPRIHRARHSAGTHDKTAAARYIILYSVRTALSDGKIVPQKRAVEIGKNQIVLHITS